MASKEELMALLAIREKVQESKDLVTELESEFSEEDLTKIHKAIAPLLRGFAEMSALYLMKQQQDK